MIFLHNKQLAVWKCKPGIYLQIKSLEGHSSTEHVASCSQATPVQGLMEGGPALDLSTSSISRDVISYNILKNFSFNAMTAHALHAKTMPENGEGSSSPQRSMFQASQRLLLEHAKFRQECFSLFVSIYWKCTSPTPRLACLREIPHQSVAPGLLCDSSTPVINHAC